MPWSSTQSEIILNGGSEGNLLKPTEAIRKGYLSRFIFFLLGIVFIGTAISTLLLYLDTYKTLDTHYSAILSIVTEIKQTLIIKTIKINVFFYLLTVIGITVLAILYSHRISGPLYRIKLYAKMLSGGRFDTAIKFRHKDAIHSLAEVLNKMSKNYNDKTSMITTEIQRLKDAVTELDSIKEKKEAVETSLKKVTEIDSRIKQLLDTIGL